MKDYKLIIFDLDGTLMDTSEGILNAVQYTIDYYGFRKLEKEVLTTFIGPPIQDSFSKAYGLIGPILQDIATVFRNRYKSVDLLRAKPYPGIYDALWELRKAGKTLAVATYKREDYALDLLHSFGLDSFFHIIHGGDHENKLKKSDIIQLCIDESGGADINNSLLIGDTRSDSMGAEKLGIDFLGVCYGFGFKTNDEVTMSNCIGLVERPEELLLYCLNTEQ